MNTTVEQNGVVYRHKYANERPPNGAIILQVKDFPNPLDHYLKTVVAFLPHNDCTPFVTWLHNIECGGYFSGNYHKTLIEAAKDFEGR